MAGKKDFDFDELWADTKKNLAKLSRDLGLALKKGEQEAKKLSRKASIGANIVAKAAQRERLFYQIGKEYVKTADKKETTNQQLQKLVSDVHGLEKQIAAEKNSLGKVQ